MDKSPDAFRTISEVADWLDTPAHVLRFWESRFTQVKPVKRAGGRRYYRPADMALLGGIKKLLHEDGMTIRGVQKLLREHGVKYVASLAPAIEGVEPITAPIPADVVIPPAPMAEMVPLDDSEPAPIEEKVVPFSRPAPEFTDTPQETETAPDAPDAEEEIVAVSPAEAEPPLDDIAQDKITQTAFNFDLPPASDVPEEPIGLAFAPTPDEIDAEEIAGDEVPAEVVGETPAPSLADEPVDESVLAVEASDPMPAPASPPAFETAPPPEATPETVEEVAEGAAPPEPVEETDMDAAHLMPFGVDIPDDPAETAAFDGADGLVGRLDYRMLEQLPPAAIDALLARCEVLYHRLSH